MRAFSITKSHKDSDILLIRTDRFFMPLLMIDLPSTVDKEALVSYLKKDKKEDIVELLLLPGR